MSGEPVAVPRRERPVEQVEAVADLVHEGSDIGRCDPELGTVADVLEEEHRGMRREQLPCPLQDVELGALDVDLDQRRWAVGQ